MRYKIQIEGQELELPEEVAGSDAQLKTALSPFFPGAANAKIMRLPEKDGVVVVQVIKQAGTKGADRPFDRLVRAKAGTNPVVELHLKLADITLNQMPPDQLLVLDKQIGKAIEAGRQQRDNIGITAALLVEAEAREALTVPTGF